MKHAIKIIIALMLLPLCIGAAVEFLKLAKAFGSLSMPEIFFFAGFPAYFLFELVFSRPIRTYVLGHELSHVIASLLCGGLPKKIKVSKKGGSVSLTKANFFISLSPYIFPIYTVFIIGAYYLFRCFFDVGQYHDYFMALIGFSLAFHLRLTLFAIRQGQPDLKMTGVFFSLVFIILANFIVLSLLLSFLFPYKVCLADYFGNSWRVAGGVYSWVWETAAKVYYYLIEELI